MQIIGYIHVCQKGEWRRSFDLILEAAKRSGLLAASAKVIISIVSETSAVSDERFAIGNMLDSGPAKLYERPTLLHMRGAAETDNETVYWYVHTKGISWFGSEKEDNVLDWIKFMLYWNIEKWENAVQILLTHDVYGCNYLGGKEYPPHYSGNFWWARSDYIQKLPTCIGPKYLAPEFWLFTANPKHYNAFTSDILSRGLSHYANPYPRKMYVDADIDTESISINQVT